MSGHFEAPVEQIDGVWRILCGGCRRPWPCAGYHQCESDRHRFLADAKANATAYPEGGNS